MRQYHITTENIPTDSPDDAYLAPADPIHELNIAQYLNGLGSEHRLQEYRSANNVNSTPQVNKRAIEREQHIKPSTTEWFKLWFGK